MIDSNETYEPTFSKESLQCKILILEDDVVLRATISSILKKAGFTEIVEVEDGQKGIKELERFKPDLVITDIKMPIVNGLEFCKYVRDHRDISISSTPILVQTALTESNEKMAVFSAGATDYVSKPIDEKEIIARVNVHLERELMTRTLREFNIRVAQELETAKSTQYLLLPSKDEIESIEKQYKIQLFHHFETCSELGGDFWTSNALSKNEFSISTVDFSGHGLNSALNVFRLHTLMSSILNIGNSPAAYMAHLNTLLEPLIPVGQFATMFYGVVNTESNTLSYSCAASTEPVIVRKDTSYETLDSSGILLGVSNKASYDIREVPFNPGDCLFLYSDALIETPDSKGEMSSAEELISPFISSISKGKTQKESFKDLLRSFYNKHLPDHINDDVTLLVINR